MNERREPKGAVQYTGGNAKYLQVSYGCLCEVSKKYVEGWTNPINQKTGETIPDKWIKVYKELEAWVNMLEWYDHKYGENEYSGWKMHMEAGGINYILDLPLKGTATQKFMFSARNIDFNAPLEIAAWTNNADGKLAVWLKQDGQTILQYYKKGDMKDCPEPVQKTGIGGKTIWDWADTERFLWEEMQNIIAPAIANSANLRTSENQNFAPTYSGYPEQGQEDDRPTYGNQEYPPANQATGSAPQSLSDLVTAKQLGMIQAITREINMDADYECQRLLRCGVAELSKQAASDFIEHLQGVQRVGIKVTPAPLVTAVTTLTPPPAETTEPRPNPTPALHGANCTCPDCDIPF